MLFGLGVLSSTSYSTCYMLTGVLPLHIYLKQQVYKDLLRLETTGVLTLMAAQGSSKITRMWSTCMRTLSHILCPANPPPPPQFDLFVPIACPAYLRPFTASFPSTEELATLDRPTDTCITLQLGAATTDCAGVWVGLLRYNNNTTTMAGQGLGFYSSTILRRHALHQCLLKLLADPWLTAGMPKAKLMIITGAPSLAARLGKKKNITSTQLELQHLLRDIGRWVHEVIFCPQGPSGWDVGPVDDIAQLNVQDVNYSMPIMWCLREVFHGLDAHFEEESLLWIRDQMTGTSLKEIGFTPVWGQVFGANTLSRAGGNLVYSFLCAHCPTASYLKWIKRLETAVCDCGQEEETISHVMFACPLHSEARDRFLLDIGLGILNQRVLDWDIVLQHPEALANFLKEVQGYWNLIGRHWA